MARTAAEWAAHPQAAAIAPLGRVSIEKIGESAPEAPPGPRRPLDGVRVLDLSRLLAGPTNARTLAEHGAEVLLVNSARLENIPLFVMDTATASARAAWSSTIPPAPAALRTLAAQAPTCSPRAIAAARWRAGASGPRSWRRCGRASWS